MILTQKPINSFDGVPARYVYIGARPRVPCSVSRVPIPTAGGTQ